VLGGFAPALVGVITVQASLAIETTWASGFGDGPLTWLTLAFRLVQLPLAVIAGTLATTALARVSAARARGDDEDAAAVAAGTLGRLAAGVLPCAVALGVLAEPLVALCFQRGAFDAAATAGTARMLEGYAWATWGICLHRVLVPMHFAWGSTRLAAALGVGALVLKVPLILVMTGPLGMGPEALPLSHAVTATLEAVGLLVPLRAALVGRGLLLDHARVLAACAVMGAVARLLAPHAHVLVTCAASGGVYLGVAALLGVRWREGPRP
jgi:putative peptidoglycan lipid II flippase